MATANVVAAWQDGANAYLVVRVDGDARDGAGNPVGVEYTASVPLADLAGKTAAQQKAALVAAVKAVRDAQLAPADPVNLNITGTVTV
jgi:hypothetical protein